MNTARLASGRRLSFFLHPRQDVEHQRRGHGSKTSSISQPRSGMVTNRRTPREMKTSALFSGSHAITLKPPHFSKRVRMRGIDSDREDAGRRQKVSVFILSWIRNIMASAKLSAQAA